MTKTLIDKAAEPIANFVFAHGAGAGQNSEFMQQVATGLSNDNINVIRFNFAYMQLAQDTGKRRPPAKSEILLSEFKRLIDSLDSTLPFFIGGKSMGGRMASILLDDCMALACICMGYPFHPPNKPEKLRTEHLLGLAKPLLVLQGQRDSFGTPAEIASYGLPNTIEIEYLLDGDHSFKPRKASGATQEQHIQQIIQSSGRFIKQQLTF
jgi:predicted alpha/beta-hydrolase family hydrolase